MFINSFEKLGKKIEDTQTEFNKLTSTRRNQLERSLRKIEDLRQQKGISETTNAYESSSSTAQDQTSK